MNVLTASFTWKEGGELPEYLFSQIFRQLLNLSFPYRDSISAVWAIFKLCLNYNIHKFSIKTSHAFLDISSFKYLFSNSYIILTQRVRVSACHILYSFLEGNIWFLLKISHKPLYGLKNKKNWTRLMKHIYYQISEGRKLSKPL